MKENKVTLRDGWSTDPGYKRLYQTNDEIAEVFRSLDLEDAGTLVDNGCGNGEFAIRAAERFPELRVYGFDALETAIAEANRKSNESMTSNCRFGVAWAHELPLEDGLIDRALFRNVLHHVENPQRVFAEFARVLKQGAVFFLKAPCNVWEDEYSSFLSDLHMLMDPSHKRFYHTPDQIKCLMEEAGIISKTSSVSTYPFHHVNSAMRDLIVRNGLEERTKLRRTGEGSWAVELFWVAIIAEKTKDYPA